MHSTVECEQGQLGTFDAEGVAIKINGTTVGKLQQRQGLVMPRHRHRLSADERAHGDALWVQTAGKGLHGQVGAAVPAHEALAVVAVAMALRKHPAVNSAWMGDFIRRNEHVNIGVAVAVDEGLLVPVVRFADNKGLTQISAEVREFAQKAKDKKLQPSDWEGNTFTISNLGMFGIESFTAIVNPPDACILAIGGIKEVPVVKNGQVVPGNVMKVTLSCDHRVVDGASGAAFLQTFKTYMEQPAAMLL